MRRREFIALIGGAAATWPRGVRAQSKDSTRHIGMLMNNVATDQLYQSYVDVLVKTLQTLGWREGQNLRVDVRWTEGKPDLIHSYAMELVATAPDLIVASSTANLKAVLPATRSIPIVFLLVSDPVVQGFISNLARPGGNMTGFSAYEFSMGAKWLDLLKQMAPSLTRIGVMFNPDTSPQSQLFLRSIEAAAPGFGVQAIAAPIHDSTEIARAIGDIGREPNGGLLFPTDNFTGVHNDEIVELAARYRLPAIYSNSEVAARKGGLMYYGIDYVPQFRQAAVYVDRILKGARPGDLPVQMATDFKLIINLKTAHALGLEIPMGLMMRANEIIE